MKKTVWMVFAVICVCTLAVMQLGIGDVMAAWSPKSAGVDEAALKEKHTVKTKAALVGKEWTVYVVKEVATANRPAVVETDVLTFNERAVVSKNLTASGYGGSNYSLRVGSDGAASWETMQRRADGKGILFLRGDIPADCSYMTGSIVYQSATGAGKTENFATFMPRAPEPEFTTAVAPTDSAAATTVTTTGGATTTTVATTSSGASTRRNRR